MIYLDHNATTRPTPEAVEAVREMLTERWHNPSSSHRPGQEARKRVERARESVAKLFNVAPAEITFTGTATESIDLAIRGTLRQFRIPQGDRSETGPTSSPSPAGRGQGEGSNFSSPSLSSSSQRTSDRSETGPASSPSPAERGRGEGSRSSDPSLSSSSSLPLFVTTPIEHEAVRMLGEDLARTGQAELAVIPVDRRGRIDLDALRSLLESPDGARIALASIQWANNETGVIQPMRAIAELCARHNVRLHTDATQLIGKHPIDLAEPPFNQIGLLSCAAHKFHGPKGIGVLFMRAGVSLASTIRGVQEKELRGGTENAPGIVGLGVAAEQARAWVSDPANIEALTTLRDRFEQRLLDALPGAVINAPREPIGGEPARLCNTISISIPDAEAQAMVLALSERGVCISAGSACASGSMEPSPVLEAMGVSEDLALGAIRISLSRFTTAEECDRAAEQIVEVARLVAADPA